LQNYNIIFIHQREIHLFHIFNFIFANLFRFYGFGYTNLFRSVHDYAIHFEKVEFTQKFFWKKIRTVKQNTYFCIAKIRN